jgi:hypothetical protein
VRIVELSNHPAELLRAARAGKSIEHERSAAWQRAKVAKAEAARDEARARHRWFAWLRGIFAVRRERARMPLPSAAAGPQSRAEESIAAGMSGERAVEASLGRTLGDEWVLLRGYHNRGGEIDHLLAGPGGLLAIEVKNLNATVHVNGDTWLAFKYDRYGNLVEQRPVTDRRGRSPSMQVNAAADELEKFLGRRSQPVTIRRAVILAHERSKVGNLKNPTVTVTTATAPLVKMITGSHDPIPASRVTEIERLIRQDHDFHAARRPKR